MEPHILRIADVNAVTDLSLTTRWRRARAADFPALLRLGGADSRAVAIRGAALSAPNLRPQSPH